MSDQTLLTLAQARSRLHVSHRTLRRLLQDGGVTIYESPTDRRAQLVNAADLAALAKPRPSRPAPEGGHPAAPSAAPSAA